LQRKQEWQFNITKFIRTDQTWKTLRKKRFLYLRTHYDTNGTQQTSPECQIQACPLDLVRVCLLVVQQSLVVLELVAQEEPGMTQICKELELRFVRQDILCRQVGNS
jgi:hypothetical protein